MSNQLKKMKNVGWFFWVGLAGVELVLAGSSQAALFDFQGVFQVQGVLRASPTTYVANGNYCARVVLTDGGSGKTFTQTNNVTVTNGVFTASLSGNNDAGADGGATTLTTFMTVTSTGAITAGIKMDYIDSGAACSAATVAGNFTDNFPGNPLGAVPFAFVANSCNQLATSATIGAGQVSGGTLNFNVGTGGVAAINDSSNSAGISGNFLKNNGAGAPVWANITAANVDLSNNGATAVSIQTGAGATGAVHIADGANANAVTMGNNTAGTTVDIEAGTAANALKIGANASAQSIAIGNNTGASAVNITAGTGGIALNGNITSALTQTGNAAATVGTGTGAVAIADGAGQSGAVNIATGAATGKVSIGNTSAAASSVTLTGGSTGGISLNSLFVKINDSPAANSTVKIGNTPSAGTNVVNIMNGASGGTNTVSVGGAAGGGSDTINIGIGAGTDTVNIGNGSGATTVNIGNGSSTNTVNIGSASAAANAVVISAGNSGGIALGSSVSINSPILLGASTAGMTGQVLTSNGPNSAPTWQSAGGSANAVHAGAGTAHIQDSDAGSTVIGSLTDAGVTVGSGTVTIGDSSQTASIVTIKSGNNGQIHLNGPVVFGSTTSLPAGTNLSGGSTITGAVNINNSGASNTSIGQGSSGSVSIGNASSGALNLISGGGVGIGAAGGLITIGATTSDTVSIGNANAANSLNGSSLNLNTTNSGGINIGTGAFPNAINIGTGGAGTVSIGGATEGSATIKANSVYLGANGNSINLGASTADTINIGAGGFNNTITIGGTNVNSVTLKANGGVYLGGNGKTIAIGTSTADKINIGTSTAAAVAIGGSTVGTVTVAAPTTIIGPNGSAMTGGIVKCNSLAVGASSMASHGTGSLAIGCGGAVTAGSAAYCSYTTVPPNSTQFVPFVATVSAANTVTVTFSNTSNTSVATYAGNLQCWVVE